ncbi:protein kinase [Streptomyces sp. SBST2-5]|uniref:Protein kinase n=1 Tax=Streptomyces composti TaxID=2720025 RepID=A0ABX1A2D8_9ACTN|nr:serine/threonine-protein kinase [Streptomyces composti]NJP49152.1 protein kinase [Streptomyces composti]
MRPLEVDEPTVVGPYRLLGRLGSGGMGRVYLGRSAGGRTVAVKVVHPHFALDDEFRARFRREVEAARRVGGAWTAPVLDADPEARIPWVATAYAAGPSLAAAVQEHGRLPVATVRAMGAGLAEALTAVHGLGLVHRDVKPSNVLLTLDGPLLIDFGIARALDASASLTSSGVSIGSPGYMSPEQILGKGVTGAADVFSLGAVLTYAATGASPFPGDSSAALLYKVVHEPPELGGLDGELRELAEACLDKDPAARPAPAEVARRLAPEGAARLVSGGWLPGPLVEEVSRAAVRLLNLEAGEPAAGPASGPVAFTSPAVPGDAAAGQGGPDVPAAPSAASEGAAVAPGGPEAAGGTGAAAAGAGSAPGSGVTSAPAGFGPAPGTPAGGPRPPAQPREPHPPTQPAASGRPPAPGTPPGTSAGTGGSSPGGLSLSVTATSVREPGVQGGRGRRVSCTVALAVAGALAAVTVGSVFVFDLLPGKSADGGASSGETASSEPPAPTVPAAYLGIWEGQGTARDTISIPLGTFRVTVGKAAVGEKLGTVRHTDLFGGTCVDILTLKKITKKQIVADAAGARNNRNVCEQARHTVTLTPTGDDLVYESDSAGSGRPEARLSRIK